MIRGNRNIADPVGKSLDLYMWDANQSRTSPTLLSEFSGWLAAFFEWFATYLLLWPANGVVSKESMRRVYDVSFPFSSFFRERHARALTILSLKGFNLL